MKTVAITFLLTLILSSPIHAFMKSATEYAIASAEQNIIPRNLSDDLDKDPGSKVDKPLVVILGDAGEVYFLFMNQLFGLHKNDEALLPCSTPLQKSFN